MSGQFYNVPGGEGLLPSGDKWEVESWIEWEECNLRRAVYGSDRLALEAAIAKVSSAVVGRTYLVGDVLTLADVAIFCRLLPLFRQGQVCLTYIYLSACHFSCNENALCTVSIQIVATLLSIANRYADRWRRPAVFDCVGTVAII